MRIRMCDIPARTRIVCTTAVAAAVVCGSVITGASDDHHDGGPLHAGAIEHILVIDLENENFSVTFGPGSPAVYLNDTLLDQGQLVVNYFATSHVSLGNYISQVSGQAPTPAINNDCIDLNSLTHPPLLGGFTNIVPGVAADDQVAFPGQIIGDGCVFPPTVMTIGDQLDAVHGRDRDDRGSHSAHFGESRDEHDRRRALNWRQYAEDMGHDPVRDYGTPDPFGGTTCAHPPIGGADLTNSAAPNDQYETRHNPFVYFHSVIDDQRSCDKHVGGPGSLGRYLERERSDRRREHTVDAASLKKPPSTH